MSFTLFIVQILNGLQFGVLLFLIAAGLTLVFGVMDFINLAHGVQYMLGAYLAVMFYALTGSFLLALMLALVAALAFGLLLEFTVFRHLYDRDHLEQVIATFGIILFLNQGVKVVWGAAPLSLPIPDDVFRRGRADARPDLSDLAAGHHRLRSGGRACCFIFWSAAPASACWCAPARPMPASSRRSASISAGCS